MTKYTEGSIAAATRQCIRDFETCASVDQLRDSVWIANARLDFDYWIASIGALAETKASLDHRLDAAKEIDVASIIVDLLGLLSQLLQDFALAANGLENDMHPNDDWEAGISSLRAAGAEVKTILTQLGNLAVVIREAATPSRLSKADATFHEDQYDEFRNHLKALILAQDPKIVDRFKSATLDRYEAESKAFLEQKITLSEIQDRLIAANLRRRHRFLFAQERGRILSPTSLIPVKATLISDGSNTMREEQEHRKAPVMEHTVDPMATQSKSSHHPDQAPSGITASAIIKPIVTEPPPMTNTSQYAQTEISTTLTQIVYPQPPFLEADRINVICPCCCLPQPREVIAKKSRWSNHLAKDICPYTCVLLGCPTPHKMYTHRAEWMQHMQESHSVSVVWECILCDSSPRFSDAPAIEVHLRELHNEEIDDAASFADLCTKDMPQSIKECPLCSWARDQENLHPADLMAHVAEHVHSFALRALPWRKTVTPVRPQLPEELVARIADWRSTTINDTGMQFDPPAQTTHGETASFQQSPYLDSYQLMCQSIGVIHDSTEFNESVELKRSDYFGSHYYFGEDDGESAQASVQDQSLAGTSDEDWPSPSKHIFLDYGDAFIDHGRFIENIDVMRSSRAPVIVLLGGPGTGKLRLATQYCHHISRRSPSTWIFWVDASTNGKLRQGFRGIASQAKIPAYEDPNQDFCGTVSRWLLEDSHDEWLLVFDDFDAETSVYTNHADIELRRALISILQLQSKHTVNGTVLVSTRSAKTAYRFSAENVIKVDAYVESNRADDSKGSAELGSPTKKSHVPSSQTPSFLRLVPQPIMKRNMRNDAVRGLTAVPDLVIGIDIGSSRTAVVFASGPEWDELQPIREWISQQDTTLTRLEDTVPTTVLYNMKGGLLDWGFIGEPRLYPTVYEDQFKHFIDQNLPSHPGVPSSHEALRFYIDFAKKLHDYIEFYCGSLIPNFAQQHIEYLFGTPPSWDSSATKSAVVHALRAAGYFDERQRQMNIQLNEPAAAVASLPDSPLLPEDAVLAVHFDGYMAKIHILEATQRSEFQSSSVVRVLEHGIDIGLITIDYAIRRRLEAQLRQMQEFGNAIDVSLYVQDMMSDANFDMIKTDFRAEPSQLSHEYTFDIPAEAFRSSTLERSNVYNAVKPRTSRLPLHHSERGTESPPYALDTSQAMKERREWVRRRYSARSQRSDKLLLTGTTIKELFDVRIQYTIAQITALRATVSEKHPQTNLKYLLFSGDLKSYPYMCLELQKHYKELIVLDSRQPQLAVASGLVKSRIQSLQGATPVFISTASYGILMRTPYDKSRDIGEELEVDATDESIWTLDQIDWLVAKGEQISEYGVSRSHQRQFQIAKSTTERVFELEVVFSSLPKSALPRSLKRASASVDRLCTVFVTFKDDTLFKKKKNIFGKSKLAQVSFALKMFLEPKDLKFEATDTSGNKYEEDLVEVRVEWREPP